MNNIVRVTNQAMAAVLGGTQSLHTNGYDEALALPSEAAAKIALRTQQIIAYESGVTDTVDPLAGSYFVEELTDTMEQEAWKYIEKIDAMGGSVQAIEEGYIQKEIADAAYVYQKEMEAGESILVGVNKFTQEKEAFESLFTVNDSIRIQQIEKLVRLRANRDNAKVSAILANLKIAANSNENLMPIIIEAVENLATLGEIADTLRSVFGEY
jgi:methylmalonyl-CoA mutase N-terminal domain/subunit